MLNPYPLCSCGRPSQLLRPLLLLFAAVAAASVVATAVPTPLLLSPRMPDQYIRSYTAAVTLQVPGISLLEPPPLPHFPYLSFRSAKLQIVRTFFYFGLLFTKNACSLVSHGFSSFRLKGRWVNCDGSLLSIFHCPPPPVSYYSYCTRLTFPPL